MKNILILISCIILCSTIAVAAVPIGVHRWHFDNTASEPSNTTYTGDEWGANPGNVTSPSFVADIDRIGDGAYNFNGDDDYIICGNLTEIGPGGPASLTFWQYSNDTGGAIFAHNGPAGGGILSISNTTTTIYGTEYFITSNVTWHNQWHFVVLTWGADSSTARLYVDSIRYTVNMASGANAMPALSNFVMGYSINSLNGTLDDVRIYNRILTPDEVLEMYNGTVEIDTGAHSNNAAWLYAAQNNWYLYRQQKKNNAWLLLLVAAVIIILFKKKFQFQ